MRYFTIIVIAMVLCGCADSDRPKKPDNLISKDKMSDILYDVFLLNAAKGINKRALENKGVLPQDYVYKKHHIDSLQFAQSNDYYSYDTKVYEAIMEKVKLKIVSEKKKYEALNEKEEKTRDSLKVEEEKAAKLDTTLVLKPKSKSNLRLKEKANEQL
ncbi:MAG: DUF4296 domain-containing protein [Gelidibacter sp.]